MWNSLTLIGWKFLRQAARYQRLAIALGLSFFLHLFLLGQFSFNLPDLSDKPQFIEAQLVSEKPVPSKVVVKPIVKNTTLAKPVQPPPSMSAAPEIASEAFKPTSPESAQLEPSLSSDGSASSLQLGAMHPVAQDEAVEPATETQADAGLIVNLNAYKYVETEFDIRTDIEAKVNSSPAGKAKIVYQLLPNGEQYQLTSLMQAKGLAALIIPDLLQTSDGYLSSAGLQPQHYLYQFGDKKNKTFRADFDWASKKLSLNTAKGLKVTALVDGAQDLLSFMYQFMFVPPLQNMQLSLTNGKKLSTYDYSFEGEEVIATKMGNLSTIHLLQGDAEGDEKTELWLALDYQHVPVKIRKTEKDGKVYELLVTSLKTEKPAIQPE